MFEKSFMEYVINKKVPFPVILKYVNDKNYVPDRKCYCPFHLNEDTPAAKLFRDSDGDSIFCFSERKVYRPSDVFRHKLIPKRLDEVFYKIWEQLSEVEQSSLLEQSGTTVSRISEKWETNKEKFLLFKQGKIGIEQHLVLILNVVD